MRSITIFLILLVFGLSACKNQSEKPQNDFDYRELNSNTKEIKEVLYSMYLPTDMADIFARSGANYDPEIPAPIDNTTLYTDPEQIAVMLGVYGVDVTYMRFLEQALPAAQYLKTLELLSSRINLPDEIFVETSKHMNDLMSNKDSLSSVIENIYRKADEYYKKNGEENLGALSLLGGWIEAMYIGVSIFESDSGNNVLAERILQQKFSLNSIYTLISNHQESFTTRSYVLLLNKLRKAYEKVDIRYQKEGFSLDTATKKIQAYNTQIRYDDHTMKELLKTIPQIRTEIITPRLNQK